MILNQDELHCGHNYIIEYLNCMLDLLTSIYIRVVTVDVCALLSAFKRGRYLCVHPPVQCPWRRKQRGRRTPADEGGHRQMKADARTVADRMVDEPPTVSAFAKWTFDGKFVHEVRFVRFSMCHNLVNCHCCTVRLHPPPFAL